MTEARSALIVDDEHDIRELLVLTLGRMGLRTDTAASLGTARQMLAQSKYDLCLTDMRLPDGSGLELVGDISTRFPETPVAMITAYGNVEAAVEALKAGAFDFVSKPVDINVLRGLVRQALELNTRRQAQPEEAGRLLGGSPAMVSLRETIAKVSRSQAPVHISGESGTGKELVARTIHAQGSRANGPFIPVNCGAIPTELMESEFFGHKKGSFTGAHADKPGLFQSADGGTLFLDEVAELPLAMQVKLLRAIQEKKVRPVGAQNEVDVDVRLLSATHKDLGALVNAGSFRHDLYYRINVIELNVPALREREGDLPLLSDAILARLLKNIFDSMGTVAQHLAHFQANYLTGIRHFLTHITDKASAFEFAFAPTADIVLKKMGEADQRRSRAIAEEMTIVPDAFIGHFFEGFDRKILFAFEVGIKRPFRHLCRIINVFNAGAVISPGGHDL